MKKISEHISFKEGIKSNTALRLNIDNNPDAYELGNMRTIAQAIFEPLREWVGGPIKINSFFLKNSVSGMLNTFFSEKFT